MFSHSKRDARTDLTGRRALLTGGRAKIGMYIALRLLRDGAHTTITTRFPKDAARRFAAMEDSADWLHRLRIVGIDLRDPSQVMALTDSLDAAGPLDIIINNAAQTVRRSGNAYKPLVDAEDEPLPAALQAANGGPELVTFGHAHDKHPLALASSVLDHPVLAGTQSLPWPCPRVPRRWNALPPAPRSTPAGWSRTSPRSTAGPRCWTKWIRWKCSKCSCAT
jgi:nucleoside-diphosphate-sugar epimerase